MNLREIVEDLPPTLDGVILVILVAMFYVFYKHIQRVLSLSAMSGKIMEIREKLDKFTRNLTIFPGLTEPVDRAFEKTDRLQHCYTEYKEQCWELDGTWYNSQQAGAFFRSEHLLERGALSNPASDLLTGLGVLGTFVGAILGLLAFTSHLGVSVGEVFDKVSISALLGSVGAAFGTSAVGLFLALLANHFFSGSLGKLEDEIAELVEWFDSRLPTPRRSSRGSNRR